MSEDNPESPFSRFAVGDVISVYNDEGTIEYIGKFGIHGVLKNYSEPFCINSSQAEKAIIIRKVPQTMGDLRIGDYLQYMAREAHDDITNRVCFVGDEVVIVDEETGAVFIYSPWFLISDEWSIYSRAGEEK